MEIVGGLKDLIQNAEYFIVVVQVLYDGTIVADQFVLLVYLVLPSDVLLGERTLDSID
jgi:hypothetical protein